MSDAKKRAYQFMRGFSAAAGRTGIPESIEQDADFLAGWKQGQIALSEAGARAEHFYGITWTVIRLADLSESP